MKNILYIGRYNGMIGGIERYMQKVRNFCAATVLRYIIFIQKMAAGYRRSLLARLTALQNFLRQAN